MTMRASASDLPITFVAAGILAGEVTILDNISLSIGSGTPTVLIGPNGSGKTTLLRAAMGLIPLTRGRISWGGRKVSPPTRRAILLQRPTMLRRRAADNVRYALGAAGVPRSEHDQRTADLLALVGLKGLERRPARRLSGGEQQRLALARALAQDPAVLFLDEPTASLDPSATQTVEAVIADASRRGIKVVMATHDLGEARRLAGDVVLLHRGRVVEAGDATAFFERPQTPEGRRFLAGELLV